MIVIFKYIIPKSYWGLTVYPFIFLKSELLKEDTFLINHENIHLKQQKELFWIFFFIWYLSEYIVRRVQYKNHYKAYKNISFEKEAYQNEQNLNYLNNREGFGFISYFN